MGRENRSKSTTVLTEGGVKMKLFVVQHKHPAEKCPAGDSQMAPMLLSHLSTKNAKKFGVHIQSEAVIDGGHTLYLTLEAPS